MCGLQEHASPYEPIAFTCQGRTALLVGLAVAGAAWACTLKTTCLPEARGQAAGWGRALGTDGRGAIIVPCANLPVEQAGRVFCPIEAILGFAACR